MGEKEERVFTAYSYRDYYNDCDWIGFDCDDGYHATTYNGYGRQDNSISCGIECEVSSMFLSTYEPHDIKFANY